MPLEKRNKRILVICPHPVGYVPGQRLKYEQYFNNWEANGWQVDVSPFMSESMQKMVYKKGFLFRKIIETIDGYRRRLIDFFRIRNYDLVYLFLWATPFGLPVIESLIIKRAKRLVYDIDDMVYLKTASPANWLIRVFKTSIKIKYCIKNADVVLVSTDKLYEFAVKFNTNIITIPATIDTSKYYPLETDKEIVRIGWSGSHTTSKYLHLLDNVLKTISQNYNVIISVMGDPNFNIEGLNNIELMHWSEENELKYLQSMDIGLHPLPDEKWVYGKSGGKIVQYMAVGLPIIASAIGPNCKAIENGYNGFLVSNKEEWIEKLSELIENKALRKSMGHHSRSIAEQKYSVSANAAKYLAAFNTDI